MTTETIHVARSVAITGAGSGLGREIAIGFADKGYRVFGTARRCSTRSLPGAPHSLRSARPRSLHDKPSPDVVDDACGLGYAMRLHCAEVSPLAPTSKGQSESGGVSDAGTGRRLLPDVKVLFIDARVDGFFLERFNDRGELVGTTQHETMDEAMWQAYSEYEIPNWRSCPEDVDPVAYIRAHADRDSHMTARDE